jgi:hypothetical protein
LAKQIDNVVVTLVAGEVQRSPIIKPLPVEFHRVVIVPLLYHEFGLIVLPLFAILSQFLVVPVDLQPELPPVDAQVVEF